MRPCCHRALLRYILLLISQHLNHSIWTDMLLSYILGIVSTAVWVAQAQVLDVAALEAKVPRCAVSETRSGPFQRSRRIYKLTSTRFFVPNRWFEKQVAQSLKRRLVSAQTINNKTILHIAFMRHVAWRKNIVRRFQCNPKGTSSLGYSHSHRPTARGLQWDPAGFTTKGTSYRLAGSDPDYPNFCCPPFYVSMDHSRKALVGWLAYTRGHGMFESVKFNNWVMSWRGTLRYS